MADDFRGRGLPPREHHNDYTYYPPPQSAAEETDRLRPHQNRNGQTMAAGSITLPSIQDYPPAAQRIPQPPHDQPRASYSVSPTEGGSHTPSGQHYLPPVHSLDGRAAPPSQESRHPHMAYRPAPAEARNGGYYQPPPPSQPRGPYTQDAYGYGYHQAPPGAIMAPYDYRSGSNTQQSSAPRQRTSIACRYCRKRKIRCSGYQTTADGKCLNCKKTGNECVFQPVSSGATAFVPVSAIPGGVAPGTQLFGAFGQPLGPPPGTAPPQAPPHQMQTPPQAALPSPTGSYYDDRMETGRRRPRGPEDDHQHGPRLPPPHPHQQEEDPRRRSPASAQSSTPPMAYHAYPRTESSTPPTAQYHQYPQSHQQPPPHTQSSHQPHQQQQHQHQHHNHHHHPHQQQQQPPPQLQQQQQQQQYHDHRPIPMYVQRNGSPVVAQAPPQQHPHGPSPTNQHPSPVHSSVSPSGKGIMSLSALIDPRPGPASSDPRDNIDNSMLGRLNARP